MLIVRSCAIGTCKSRQDRKVAAVSSNSYVMRSPLLELTSLMEPGALLDAAGAAVISTDKW